MLIKRPNHLLGKYTEGVLFALILLSVTSLLAAILKNNLITTPLLSTVELLEYYAVVKILIISPCIAHQPFYLRR